MSDFIQRWPNAIVHVDADCFYVSCERLRRPELHGKIVGVLSNQDACIVAKSYEAKALGIKTGTPVWDARKLCPDGIWLQPDFCYYGQMSRRLYRVLDDISPEVEPYSIDEAYLSLNGLRGYHRRGYGEIGSLLQEKVRAMTGLPVSVGVATTKTLAKLASEKYKPYGLTVVDARGIEAFLDTCAVEEIPGIGSNRAALLHKFAIDSAGDFARADRSQITRLLDKPGEQLWWELNGQAVLPLQMSAPAPKQVAKTSSLGRVTGEKRRIWAMLSFHTFRLAATLAGRSLQTKRLTVFLGQKDQSFAGETIKLPRHTDAYPALLETARRVFARHFRPNRLYRNCGVIAGDLAPVNLNQSDLFGDWEREEKQRRRALAVASANGTSGRGTIFPAVQLPIAKIKLKGVREARLLQDVIAVA